MTKVPKKPDEAHKPIFKEKTHIRPVEFVVRGGYASIEHVALYLDLHRITIYHWAVLRDRYPVGFPPAVRIGRAWRIPWEAIIAFKDQALTYKEEKARGMNMYAPGEDKHGKTTYDSDKLFMSDE